MVLDIEESKKKYREYIKTIEELKSSLEELGYEVVVNDSLVLEATYTVNLRERNIARIWWSVPHYLEFEPYVDQKKSTFSIDYIKNIEDWRKFIDDIHVSLREYVWCYK